MNKQEIAIEYFYKQMERGLPQTTIHGIVREIKKLASQQEE